MRAPGSNDSNPDGDPLWGVLLHLPDLTWEDFERGNELARRDLEGGADEDVRPT